jgi:hypothetical protein
LILCLVTLEVYGLTFLVDPGENNFDLGENISLVAESWLNWVFRDFLKPVITYVQAGVSLMYLLSPRNLVD